MARGIRFCKLAALVSGGGLLWMWGAGSCVPYNFYATLLGDTIITGTVTAVLGTVLNAIGIGGTGT